jgi:hypothetical protein
MKAGTFALASVLAFSLSSPSCNWRPSRTLNLNKVSPTGEYRAKVNVLVVEQNDSFGGFSQSGKIQVLKGNEVIYERDLEYQDHWEPTFIDANPIIEWVDSNILRMGSDRSKESVSNHLVVSNNTAEVLSQMDVSCGRYESYLIFNVPPNSQLSLYPNLNPNADEYGLGYGGQSQSGKNFSGVLRYKRLPGNSLRLEITVTTSVFKF